MNVNENSQHFIVTFNISPCNTKQILNVIITEDNTLISKCSERLMFCFQLFISGEEVQGPQLLSTIIQRPNLGGLLGPHFTPVAGGASTFLQMYQTVVDLSTGSNVDLCFVLLSKVGREKTKLIKIILYLILMDSDFCYSLTLAAG